MSRSNDEDLKNPATHFLQWKGEKSIKKADGKIIEVDKHFFSYYNKEKKESIEVPLPVTFIVLDILHTINGFNEEEGARYYSNEIKTKMFATHPFRVKLGKHDAAEGIYSEIMPALKGQGAKYCQSVYALMKEGDDWVINNFQLQGAAFGAWMEFCRNTNVMKCAVKVSEWIEGVKGNNTFNIPVFKAIPVSNETNNIAIEKDAELQKYLTKYFENNSEKAAHEKAEKYLAEETEPLPTLAEPLPTPGYATDLPF